ncbi:hypothetical protein [Ethanoligenens sp.]|uniref:hypothetical protein n=1 Tax=Ethanoligenens sp. TaxID=2099655 RepID=UPI0039E9393C
MRLQKMNFTKRLRLRVGLMAACLCMGLAILVISAMAKRFYHYDYAYLLGLGAGLAAGGAIKMQQALRVLRDPERCRVARIEEEDERNRSMEMRSSHATFYIGMVALAVASVIAAFYDQKVMHTLATVLLLLVALKGVSLLTLRRLG